MAEQQSSAGSASEIARLIDVLRADEGDSVTILCDNPDFNGQPNCAIECCGDWTGWLHKRFAADTLLDALSMAMVERNLPSPRKVIATSNGHHWIERFNLICCRDCGFVRRADDQNSPCKGAVGVGIRMDLLPEHIPTDAQTAPDISSFLNAVYDAIGDLETDKDGNVRWSALVNIQRGIGQKAHDLAAQPPAAPVETARSDGKTIGEFYGDPRPGSSAASAELLAIATKVEHWGFNVLSEAEHKIARDAAVRALRSSISPQASAGTDVVREALELAEDVLSRAPFSTGIWPNGMHPQIGIDKIRDAIRSLNEPQRSIADREGLHKSYAEDWHRQIINAGGDENIAHQAVTLAALNGLFDHVRVSVPRIVDMESAIICALIDASKGHGIELHEHDIGILARSVVGNLRDLPQTASSMKPNGCDPCDYPYCGCWKSPKQNGPWLQTVTIVLPSGYKTAEELAKDCGFQIVYPDELQGASK